jgi:hypothetical protein
MEGFHVAQLNIGRLHHPLESPETAEFHRAIGPINALAESSPGFVWRLVDDEGRSSSYVRMPGEDDPLEIVNMSVWEDLESLKHFMYRSGHAMYLRRRREWFVHSDVPTSVCWWIPAGELPDLVDAQRRLLHLREHGPTEFAWPVHHPITPGV